jgi:hypothetical protein
MSQTASEDAADHAFSIVAHIMNVAHFVVVSFADKGSK